MIVVADGVLVDRLRGARLTPVSAVQERATAGRLVPAAAQTHRIEGLPGYRELGLDLLQTTGWRYFSALIRLPLCVVGFFVAAQLGWWWATPVMVFLLLSAVVSFTHDIAHGSVGRPGWRNEIALFLGGLPVLGSGHAYRITHMHHHANFPAGPDPEGDPSRWPLWRALLMGPVWLLSLWWWAFRRARGHVGERVWMLVELSLRPMGYAVAWLVWPVAPSVMLFMVLVHVATWVFPLLTVWLPHRGYGATPIEQTGTLRGWLVPRLFFEATYHLEHHLYPSVPAHHLAELSRRLEPELLRRGVVPRRVL